MFTTSVGTSLIGRVYFNQLITGLANPNAISTYTNRRGEFGASVTNLIWPGDQSRVPTTPGDMIVVFGVDPASGMTFDVSTPPNGTTVSPLTTVLDGSWTSPAVAAALRLYEGPNALSSQRNLVRFDAGNGLFSSDPQIADDAARLTSINIQLLGVGYLLARGNTIPLGQSLDRVGEGLYAFGAYIRSTGRGDLRSKTEMMNLIRTVVTPDTSEASIDAAAELLADFAASVPAQVRSPDVAARYELGLAFDVMPQVLRLLFRGQTALIPAMRARTPESLTADFAVYANAPRQLIEPFSFAFASPDYREVPAGGSITLTTSIHSDPNLRPLWTNDYTFLGGGPSGENTTINSVSVTAENATRIAVTLNADGTIRIDALPGFTGVTYFDYRLKNGQSTTEVTGRAYIRVGIRVGRPAAPFQIGNRREPAPTAIAPALPRPACARSARADTG
ncbi:Ig-like domain-containing protein [Sphingosinicella sp. LHD-64]|uniref:Ig-like domain-containing protein n=1 Tax=Sphingosinicella sp. LHD-64 TaxID=3072139 RepID=UPI00280DE1A3|nr:Ig-like domain-containing protein [Sphingosinicella sp. LHD-64]MDQ8757646.1 Ig-like domain-containing protein [Sphingosinicella sp. LHD-64]